jgi:hypothetical protein
MKSLFLAAIWRKEMCGCEKIQLVCSYPAFFLDSTLSGFELPGAVKEEPIWTTETPGKIQTIKKDNMSHLDFAV